jgi:SAM-dependent methyltransferase
MQKNFKRHNAKKVLDFPCGHGGVLRYFKSEWPQAEYYGVEIDPDALEFCEKTFGANPIIANAELSMALPKECDLIFSGSLLTHFDEWQWDRYLRLCIDALSERGVLVFTVHGRIAASMARDNHPVYGNLIDLQKLFDGYKRKGFEFLPYSPEYPTFGLSLSSPAWLMNKIQSFPELKVIYFEEGGWGQDVVGLQKNPWRILPELARSSINLDN